MSHVVNISEIAPPGSLYVRESHDEARVDEFVAIGHENPSILPPIKVIRDPKTGKYRIIDGLHRYLAAIRLGLKEIVVDVIVPPEGTSHEGFAVLYAIEATATGPLSPTPADRRRMCDLLLMHCPEMSDAEVARRCG